MAKGINTRRDLVNAVCAADKRVFLHKIKMYQPINVWTTLLANIMHATDNLISKSNLNVASQGKKGESGLPGVDGLPGSAVRTTLTL